MGAIDEYLHGLVGPQLWQGESIQGCAHAREPHDFNALLVPTRFDHWLMVVTNYRLLFFRTAVSGMWDNAPKKQATDPKIFALDDLREVVTKVTHYGQIVPGGPPTMMALRPHPHCGPFKGESFRVDMYGVAEGLDAQHRFTKEFPGWLAQQVAAGAYPMNAEKVAWIQAETARLAAEHQQRMIAQAARDAEFRKKVGPALKVVGLVLALALSGFAIFVGVWEVNQFSRNDGAKKELADLEKTEAKIKAGELPASGCGAKDPKCGVCINDRVSTSPQYVSPGHTLKDNGWKVIKDDGVKWWCPPAGYDKAHMGYLKESIERDQGNWNLGLLKLLGGIVGVFATVGLGLFLRKRAKAAAAGAPPVPAA